MKIAKKLSALVLSTMFASMQLVSATPFDTGLGAGNGGAVINSTSGGFVNATTNGTTADLNFNGDSHVNWNTLNVNSGETLNFNAVQGASGVTVLNTVSQGVSNIMGQINANSGISNLVISNPNGVVITNGTIMSGGDVTLTTQPMTASYTNGAINITNIPTTNAVEAVTIKDSNFTTTGEFNILSPVISAENSNFTAGGGVKLITSNGQDYLSVGNSTPVDAVRLEAVNIDGDVYIVSDKGFVRTTNGGEINGNLTIDSNDSVVLNYVDNGKRLHVTGNVNATGNGAAMYARNTDVDGNLTMENGGGFLEVGNVNVGKDMQLTTTAKSENGYGYKHFVHIVGTNDIKGNVTVDSKNNVHIGNYNYDEQSLLDGSLTVGGTLDVHAEDGHIMTTINTTADKIKFVSDNLNVLSNDTALLTANEYQFSSNGYIGAISDYTKPDGTVVTADSQIVSIMENYTYIPKDIKSHNYMNIAGGKITMLDTPEQSSAYIASNGNLELTGANAGDVNLTAYGKRIDITGNDVHAKNINIGNETKTLKVEFPGRDYTLNYTSIKDQDVVTIRPDEEITYELSNAPDGYNLGLGIDEPRAANTTFLIGPDETPTPPPPGPDPDPTTNGPDDEPGRQLYHWVPEDVTKAPTSTPIAYAADLDDDELDRAVRKNVDGSVTVVRAFAME